MKHVVLGLLLAALVLYPGLGLLLAAPLGTLALWLAAQPLLWAFALGAIARPHLTRRYGARTPGGAR